MDIENRTCKKCGKTKSIVDFYWSRCKSNGKKFYNWQCKLCQSRSSYSSPNRRNSINKYLRKYRRNADNKGKIILSRCLSSDRRKNLKCDLDIQFIESLFINGCKYCGESERLKLTLDRIDNNLGHSKNNVVCCCIRCNFIRRDMPINAFEYLAPYIKEAREKGLFGEWYGCSNKL